MLQKAAQNNYFIHFNVMFGVRCGGVGCGGVGRGGVRRGGVGRGGLGRGGRGGRTLIIKNINIYLYVNIY